MYFLENDIVDLKKLKISQLEKLLVKFKAKGVKLKAHRELLEKKKKTSDLLDKQLEFFRCLYKQVKLQIEERKRGEVNLLLGAKHFAPKNDASGTPKKGQRAYFREVKEGGLIRLSLTRSNSALLFLNEKKESITAKSLINKIEGCEKDKSAYYDLYLLHISPELASTGSRPTFSKTLKAEKYSMAVRLYFDGTRSGLSIAFQTGNTVYVLCKKDRKLLTINEVKDVLENLNTEIFNCELVEVVEK